LHSWSIYSGQNGSTAPEILTLIHIHQAIFKRGQVTAFPMSLSNDKIDTLAEHHSMELVSASDGLHTGSPSGEHPPEPTEAIAHTQPSDTNVSTKDGKQEPATSNDQSTVRELVVDDARTSVSAGEDPSSATQADELLQHADTNLSIEIQKPLADTTRILHEIDPEGDVILDLDDGVSIRVASAVLRLSSHYFKTRLFGPYGEGKVERSTTKPQRLPLKGWDPDVTHRLFCLMHYQPELEAALEGQLSGAALGEEVERAARRLRDLALVAEYLQCAHSLTRICDSFFKDFAVQRVRGVIPFQATVDLAATAYIMESHRYFRLFTKSLVTDYTERFEDAELPFSIPDRMIAELTRQSMHTWVALKNSMHRLDQFQCTAAYVRCYEATDSLIVQNLTARLLPPGTPWPELRSESISLRHLLVGIYNLDGVPRVGWCATHKGHTHDVISPMAFKHLFQDIDDEYAEGLCRYYVSAPEDGYTGCRCMDVFPRRPSHDIERKWVCRDSFMTGIGR
jgi:hypothetical protein